MTSSLNIYVSDAHARALRIKGVRSARLYNALNDQFAAKAYATAYKHRHGGVFRVLMVASLRDYKGVPEFIKLAVDFFEVEDIHFDLLVNDEQTDISRYFRKKSKPINLSVHPRVVDTTPFYANASLVLNLSRVNECIESFGLTILEAMAFGNPVIAPPIGGPAELVTHDVHGLLIDSKLSKKLFDGVNFLRTDEISCNRFSAACRLRASEFSQSVFSVEIVRLIKGLNIYADF